MKVRIGTRGSELALWQARHVAALLAAEGVSSELVVMKTRGDVIDDVPLTQVEGKAFFTAEIERALLERTADLAVHSHKDLPTEITPGLVVAAIPRRGPRGERLLVAPEAHESAAPFLPLARGARVGTSAPRRGEQLLALRPDLQVLALRGNVPTRVKRLREGRYDAIVLAAAGLERLGLDTSGLADVALSEDLFVPAPAQGALALQVRASDAELLELLRSKLHDEDTARLVEAERSLLVRAGGGCNLPLAASIEPGSAPGSFVARAFLGADHPRPGVGPRWARVEAREPEAAIEGAYAVLATGEATGCGPFAGLLVALAGSASEETRDTRLGARLETLGARVAHERVLAFQDVVAPELAERAAALRAGDALAVTSRQAARRLEGIRVQAGVTIAAVGAATARALESVGLRASVVGSGGARELALALPLAPGARVLFPCAEEAVSELEDALAARAIALERAVLYRTVPVPDAEHVEDALVRVYMSPSAVEASLDWERSDARPRTLRVALGRTTARALERAGLAAEEPEGSLVDFLARRLARLRAPSPAAPEPTR